ncbi:hypothetical protein BS329_36865 [Amycolatopsis coloradensis]|uniref:Uncharacterized protein n=1 Tax=Amycolatopsis coloradensis TaxID=76021 RepID=A0A1R0KFX7_9PSEU|nr:hypothetical protein BS329_36865 [Amycolatopsis coloradensis]
MAVAEPHEGRTLIVGAIRGDADDVLPLRAGLLLPYGCAGDRMHATALPQLPEPRPVLPRLPASSTHTTSPHVP